MADASAAVVAADDAGSAVADAAAARAVVAPLYADRRLATGEDYLEHADGLVAIVQPLRDEPELLAAGYLFAAHEVLRDADEWLRGRFGAEVAQLVGDLRQLMRLSERTRGRGEAQADAAQQSESLRKMLLAMCNDLRVVLLRLASRLQSLRWFAASRQEGEGGLRQRLAHETLELYAPLANRLGIWQLKWELEDLAFRFLQPETYKTVARLLDEKRAEREGFIDESLRQVRELLAAAGLRAEVSGRPKPARWRSRSAPATCTSGPSWAWPRTGATRRAVDERRAARPTAGRPTTSAWPGCASCSPGARTSAARAARGPVPRWRWLTTASTC